MHSLFRIVPSTDETVIDLVDLATLKLELGITGTTEDETLAARITRESKLMAEYCNRDFGLTDAVETFDFERFTPYTSPRMFGQMNWQSIPQALTLRVYPVRSIDSITVDGNALAEGVDFECDLSTGRLFRLCAAWSGRIVVTYTGGYDLPGEAPALLASACIESVRWKRISVGRDPTIRELSHGDIRTGFFSEGVTTAGVNTMIADLLREFVRPSFA